MHWNFFTIKGFYLFIDGNIENLFTKIFYLSDQGVGFFSISLFWSLFIFSSALLAESCEASSEPRATRTTGLGEASSSPSQRRSGPGSFKRQTTYGFGFGRVLEKGEWPDPLYSCEPLALYTDLVAQQGQVALASHARLLAALRDLAREYKDDLAFCVANATAAMALLDAHEGESSSRRG